MLDQSMRKLIDPFLNGRGAAMAARGWTANRVTLVGLALGMVAAVLIAIGVAGWIALMPLLAGRVADGLDGAVARATKMTDFGGFFDIVCDFAFYGAIPLAFVLRDPGVNAVAGAFLLASFYVNGAVFLAYAILAEKRGLQTNVQGEKSLYFSVGLLEGTETIGFFAAFCVWPSAFVPLAWIFGGLCLLTAVGRIILASRVFGPGKAK